MSDPCAAYHISLEKLEISIFLYILRCVSDLTREDRSMKKAKKTKVAAKRKKKAAVKKAKRKVRRKKRGGKKKK